eukprot:203901-Rhodomonas_salina.3
MLQPARGDHAPSRLTRKCRNCAGRITTDGANATNNSPNEKCSLSNIILCTAWYPHRRALRGTSERSGLCVVTIVMAKALF